MFVQNFGSKISLYKVSCLASISLSMKIRIYFVQWHNFKWKRFYYYDKYM